jgi:mono/diheme cytochrome c family protein
MPDLRFMTAGRHEAFNEIVLNGILAANGMAAFADILTATDAERIRQYVISQALEDQAAATN